MDFAEFGCCRKSTSEVDRSKRQIVVTTTEIIEKIHAHPKLDVHELVEAIDHLSM